MARSRGITVALTAGVLAWIALASTVARPLGDSARAPESVAPTGARSATAAPQPESIAAPTTSGLPTQSSEPGQPPLAAPSEPLSASPLRALRGNLVDAAGDEVHLTGVNWFGLETGTFAPHGLWARHMDEMLDQIVQAGFNTIRLPFSNQLFEPSSKPNGIDFNKNPDLQGLTGLEIMDQVIDRAGRRGLKVILDRHRPTADAQSELWYTNKVPEQRWTDDWVMLATRYRGNPTVIGADLHNEPHGPATWGDGNPLTDWRLAAERAGNAILAANPDWLIVVEGVERQGDDWYWWGGNLAGARQFPVRLSEPDKLVYEAHDYGPGVSQQRWFQAPDFPANLPTVWHDHWAYLKLEGIAPVLVGEFGGRSVGLDPEGVWQRTLMRFLRENGFDYTYWAWNPNSGDTGGVLQDDWSTLNQAKLGILAAYQWPLLGAPDGQARPERPAGQSVIAAFQGPSVEEPKPTPADSSQPDVAHQTLPPAKVGTRRETSPAVNAFVPGGAFAVGGPFDPDIQHALAGIGAPHDPDAARRQARERDERRYLEQFGKPWAHAAYATTADHP